MVKVEINHKRCGGAGECIDICPNSVWVWKKIKVKTLGMFESEREMPVPEYPDKCTACMKCYDICPTKCIKITK
ncbi:MAG: ferredoxin family protein [Candidatus Altarchaeum sp.]|nr:ferredoxin family protein [Candidatus Altarchaeum sp.]